MPPRSRLTPWIESLILSYGNQEATDGGGAGGRLKAHVIGVGQMTQSQARGSDGPTGLLFLSDGVLQIPAVLTASGWENLQEQEERECFSSLLNATVFLQDYRLRFHMDPEQTRCRFFLSVGELATTAAGPVKDNTPCCTSLASVRTKICRTWRSLLGQEGDSQRSQEGLDLSELLGEWQHDCLQTLLRDVRERLAALRSSRPSTSAQSPSPSCCAATGWDRDRLRYRGEPSFSVPAKLLMIPEGAEAGGRSRASSVEEADWQIMVQDLGDAGVETGQDAGGEARQDAGGESVQDAGGESEQDAGDTGGSYRPLLEDVAPLIVTLPSNPWDMFPPPCVSSDSSPDATPSLPSSRPDPVAVATGTHSFLPPYQNQPPGTLILPTPSPSSATASPAEPPSSEGSDAPTALQKRPADAVPGSYRKPKRKRCEVTPVVVEEEEFDGSPPSWLFDSQVGASRDEKGGGPNPAEAPPRKSPNVHSDGRPFSYAYSVSGQNLQDFSQIRVAASLLHWAVKYLLTPKPIEDPQSGD